MPGIGDTRTAAGWSRALKSAARSGVRVDLRNLEPVRVLRDALGLALVLGGSLAFFTPAVAMTAGLGAFLGTLATYQRSWRPAPVLAVASGLSLAAAVFFGYLVGTRSVLFPVLLAAWTFLAGLSWAAGATVGAIATASVAVMLLPAAVSGSVSEAVVQAGVTALGGMAPVMMALLFPVRRWRAQRDAVGNVLAALADYARRLSLDPRALVDPQPLITAGLAVAATPRVARSRPAELHDAVVLAERIRLVLAALADASARRPQRSDERDRIGRVLESAGAVLDAAAQAIRRGDAVQVPEATRIVLTHTETGEVPPTGQDGRNAERLADLLSDLVDRIDGGDDPRPPSLSANHVVPKLVPTVVRRTAAEFRRPESPILRHAFRLSVVVTLCYILSTHLPLEHTSWAPLAALMVMRPDFALTYSRALGRLAGTVVGAALSAGIVQLTHPGTVACALLAVGCAALVYLFVYAGYGLVLACASGYVVFLLSMDGQSWTRAVPDRILLTVLGGGLAMLAYALYPAWETHRLEHLLANWLGAAGNYAAAVLDRDAGNPAADVQQTLLDVRTAWEAWWNARGIATLEPVRHRGIPDAAADAADLALRRLGHTAVVLEARSSESPIPEAARFAESLRQATETGRRTLLEGQIPEWDELRGDLDAWDDEHTSDPALRHAAGRILDHLDEFSDALAQPG